MPVQPDGNVNKVQFCEQHNPTWLTEATNIGTTTIAVNDLIAKTTAARDAFNAQKSAQDIAKSATNTFNMAVEAMSAACAEIIKSIKTKAGVVGDSVYSLANIPVPATPTPMGPLGQPSNFKAALTQDGFLETSWKNTNPAGASGAVYQIWRRIGGTGEFDYLGGVGGKKFTDTTIPAGSSQLTYKIQAVRSTSIGPVATFNVTFGVDGGTMSITQVEDAASKKAA
jgi:hypothetical protein